MIRRTALVVTALALAAAPSEGQTRFEVAMGPQFGVQDRETPISRGWIVSTGFEIDGQDYVVEGSWHRARSTDERYFGGDRFWEEIGLEQHSGRILTLAAGVRSRDQEGVIAPFYHVLLGGIQAVWRTGYEYPDSIDVDAENARCGGYADGVKVSPCLNVPYPEYREQREQGFMMQPGLGLDVRIRRDLAVRVTADLLFMVNRTYVAGYSRMSARVVIGWGGD